MGNLCMRINKQNNLPNYADNVIINSTSVNAQISTENNNIILAKKIK
jgi:hypothetical protein